MKIAAKQSDKYFSDMNLGDIFRYNGNYFMRIRDCGVNLETGALRSFSKGECIVAAPNAVLVFEEQLK